MANRFWTKVTNHGTGNWSDTNMWSASTGGAGGTSVPTSADNVYFDANSFDQAGAVVTVDAAAYCLDMDWTGATNTPTLIVDSGAIIISGDFTSIAAMVIPTAANYLIFNGNGITITTNGLTIGCNVNIYGGIGSVQTLGDELTTTGLIYFRRGVFVTDDNDITTTKFWDSASSVTKVLTLGSSVINCTEWNLAGGGLIVTANTATINISGTGAFAGGDVDYNGASFNLNGTAHTVSGSFTCATLALKSDAVQTITLTAGEIITCTTATLSGDASHTHLIKSGTAGTLASIIATNHTDSYVTYTDIRRSWSTLKVGEVLVYSRALSAGE